MAPKSGKVGKAQKSSEADKSTKSTKTLTKSQSNGKIREQSAQRKRKQSVVSPGETGSEQAEKRQTTKGSPASPEPHIPSSQCPSTDETAQEIQRMGTTSDFKTPPNVKNNQDLGQSPSLEANVRSISTNDAIMRKFDSINNRLKSLSSIEKQLSNINITIATLDIRITDNEKELKNVQRTITGLEESRNFDSATLDSIRTEQSQIKETQKNAKSGLDSGLASISKLSVDLNSVMSQNQDLKKENEGLQEQLIDLKACGTICFSIIFQSRKLTLKMSRV